MNASKLLNTKAGMVTLGLLTVGVLLYFFGGKAKQAVKDAAAAVGNVNAGTPYEGAGVVGTLGNAANAASGGVFEELGGWLGGKVYDWTHADEFTQAGATNKTAGAGLDAIDRVH